MLVKFTDESYTITAKTAVSGRVAQPRNLQIECGRVWLTIEGETDDHWLNSGDVFTLPAHRLIVIEADQQASRIQFKKAHAMPASTRGFAKLESTSALNNCPA